MQKILYVSLVASTLLLADTDLDLLKEQVAKQQLMIDSLLKKIEKTNTTKEVAPKAKPAKSKTFAQSSYMPNLSLIADLSYVSRNEKDDVVKHLEVPGVAHGLLGTHTHDGNTHAPYNANNGFNLNYAELGLSSAVDPFFSLNSIFHFSENNVEIEELYFTSTALGYNTRVKGGKFNSNFGYLNEQHHHAWSFADMPLVYESFLGMHAINEIGLQLQWTAPTSNYLMLGVEVLQGENEQMFGNASIGNEENIVASSEDAPTLFIAYAKSSIDIKDTTILGGISYAKGISRIDHSTDEEEPHAFAGDSSIYGVDLTVKHFFDSYSSLTWQTEYLYRDMDGEQYSDINTTAETWTYDTDSMRKQQGGIYSQLVYAPNKSWQMGLRYESIFQNDVIKSGTNTNQPTDLNKYSAMLEYRTSEFARLRLQYNRNEALYDEEGMKKPIDSLIFQVNIAIGAHGAHSF